MSFSLSAPPRPIPPTRQKTTLLMVSAALHAAVLIPIALNTVFIPSLSEDRDFEVWLDIRPTETRPPEPRPIDPLTRRPLPVPKQETPVEQERPEQERQEQVRPEPKQTPTPQEQQRQVSETLSNDNSRQQIRELDRSLPQMSREPALPNEALDTPSPTDQINPLGTALPTVTRPMIEEIDGPNVPSHTSLDNRRLPSMAQSQSAGASEDVDQAAGQTDSDMLDAPVPRRARIDADTEAALAAAASGGALDDAWTYRPPPGGASGGTPPSGGASGGGVQGNTATNTGRIHFGRTTPYDCSQPQMLSDVQRLSCDSTADRRMRDAMARNQRIQGTGDANRDARMSAEADERLRNYDIRRRPLSGGTGVEPVDTTGSGRGAILDEMSGTNREVKKLQDQMAPVRGPSTTPDP